jgi:lipopolysaccharide/colanic/teichoic acid biosynthesis glycosyltransferase
LGAAGAWRRIAIPAGPRGGRASDVSLAVKYTLDRVIALGALLLLAPLVLVLAVAVRLSSSGPAVYRQRRVGLDGRVFEMLKFRSMAVCDGDAEVELAPGLAPGGVEGEDRRTALGRWLRATSLDELPQLVNVVRGEMALIGPRPERPVYAVRFADCVPGYAARHRVKPGITGWAQVHGLRGRTPIDERVRCDNDYIEHWSAMLDLKIIALTFVEVLRMRDRACGGSTPPRRAPREQGRLTTPKGRVVHVRLRPAAVRLRSAGVARGHGWARGRARLVGGLGAGAPARVREHPQGDILRDL